MKSQEEQKALAKFLNTGKKFLNENEPIHAECPNRGNPCFCTGECHRVIGWRKKTDTSALASLDQLINPQKPE